MRALRPRSRIIFINMRLSHPLHWSVFLQTATIFALTSVLSLVAVFEIQARGALGEVPPLSLGELLIGFAIATIVILILVKTTENPTIVRFIFGFALFAAVVAFALVYVDPWPAVGLGIAALILRRFAPYVAVQNITLIVAASGIAFTIGFATSWKTMAAVLIILAIYDLVAVYGTKHMVVMFRKLLARGVYAGFIVPERLHGWIAKPTGVKPSEGFTLVGTGDVALPAAFVVAVAAVGLHHALGALVGTLAGLFVTHFIFEEQRIRKPVPALPAIVAGAILGFLIVLFVW